MKAAKIIYISICGIILIVNLLLLLRIEETGALIIGMGVVSIPAFAFISICFLNQEFSIKVLFFLTLKSVSINDITDFYLMLERVFTATVLMVLAWSPYFISL